jgi:hypothetical protein
MAYITESEARSYASPLKVGLGGISKKASVQLRESMEVAKAEPAHDIFLAHSLQDADVILGVKNLLRNFGFSSFVDWADGGPLLSRSDISSATAAELRVQIRKSHSLLVCASDASRNSRWVPWEIGYADGVGKPVAVLQLVRALGPFPGSEYLGLYPHIEKANSETGRELLWVIAGGDAYAELREWLGGKKPSKFS